MLCSPQDKPGPSVPAGLQGGLQNPVSREEGQMSEAVQVLMIVRPHQTNILDSIARQGIKTKVSQGGPCEVKCLCVFFEFQSVMKTTNKQIFIFVDTP